MYQLHNMDLGNLSLAAMNPAIIDSNAIITALVDDSRLRMRIGSSMNSVYIPQSVMDEVKGVTGNRSLCNNSHETLERLESRVVGMRGMPLSDKRSEYYSTIFQDTKFFEDNMDRLAEDLYTNQNKRALDIASKGLAYDRTVREYLSNLITKAIAQNKEKLTESKADALYNLVTDAELVFMGLYSALKGKQPKIVSDDSDVSKIIGFVWNEVADRTMKLMDEEEAIEMDGEDTLYTDNRRQDVINAELDLLQDLDLARMDIMSSCAYNGGCSNTDKLSNIAKKVMR